MKILAACIVCLVCLSSLAVPAAAADGGVGIKPATITGSLAPGETQKTTIEVTLPGSMPKGDVVFAFDTTGSMGQVLDAMKSQGIQVMNDIRAAIPDTRFGAASFMDYPQGYTSFYGYTCKDGDMVIPCVYGDAGDYAFLKNQDLTAGISDVSSAIKGIPKGSGGDLPEDYARVIYESRNFGWRPDAKKIYVIFGDAPAHAAPNGSTLQKPWEPGKLFTRSDAPYGGDPGGDLSAYTDDDIDYDLVIHEAAAAHIAIVGAYCPSGGKLDTDHTDAENNFRYMAYMTNGLFVVTDPAGDSTVIASQIVSMIRAMATQSIRELGLQVEETDYRGWVAAPVSTDVAWPSTVTIDAAITPPAGTNDGDYSFRIDVVGDGVVLGTIPVTIHVASGKGTDPIPVSIDVKPGSCPNSFNVKENGDLPVAILGDKNLKVSSIDPKSIVLTRAGGTAGVTPARWSISDVSSPSLLTCSCGLKTGREDRKQDLNLKFDAQNVVKKLGIKQGEGCIKVTITASLKSCNPKVPGAVIQGSDYLSITGSGHGSCGGGDTKDGKGSGDNKGSCDGKGSFGEKGSCGDKGSSGDDGHKGW